MGLNTFVSRNNHHSNGVDKNKNECTCSLSAGENTKIQIWSYKESKFKNILCWLATILTLGALRLFFYWKPTWRVALTCDLCPLENAELVLIRDEDRQWFLRMIKHVRRTDGFSMLCPGGSTLTVDRYRYFTHRKVVYVWHQEMNCFHRLLNVDHKVSCNYFHNCRPLTSLEAAARYAVHGANEIVVQLKPIFQLVFVEALNPFYVFQVFSVSVWFADEYYYYASVIVFMSVGSIAVDVYQIRKNQRALRDTIASTDMVTVIRDDKQDTQPSTCLVPGDVIVIPQFGCVMQCDAVLICGNCIVNESMLTGESVPVTKTPIPKSETSSDGFLLYDDKHHAKHTLYNGTKILQTRYYSGQSVKAVVIRTGFSTTKGQLVRSIMYPKPVDFEFTKDLLRFVGVLASVAAIGFLYTIVLMAIRGISIGKIIIRSFDIITIVVPPALPAAMTIGIMAAEQRLKKRNIYCIAPSTINTCGGLTAVCFDKTGTLTEEGLDLLGVLISRNGVLYPEVQTPAELGPQQQIVQAIACCHSLTRIDNELTGDPLDVILFRETSWILEEPEIVEESGRYDMLAPTVVRPNRSSSTSDSNSDADSALEIGILRQFTFSSSLQRMSVVVRVLGSPNLILFCKGAPETIVSLCKPESVPEEFSVILQKYAKKGYRVLAAASRMLEMSFVKAQRAPREQLEAEMIFLGLVILENRLKSETTPVIAELNRASIRNVMVTGDNILTAVSVARDCGILNESRRLYLVEAELRGIGAAPMIRIKREDFTPSTNVKADQIIERSTSVRNWDAEDNEFIKSTGLPADYQLAVTGPTFAVFVKNFPHLIPQLVAVCDVFARMAPEQKAQLVNFLQELGYIVAMCGDGANDCGALKAAHAGISLSEAEASIASPFTSKTPNIRCVPNVIREGRAALVTSFGIFKYMAGYSLTQFMSVSILYWIGTNLADFQFLYIDLFLITVFAVLYGYTPAAETLASEPPPTRILSVSSITSIFLQLLIVAAFQVFAFQIVTLQPWYVPFTDPGDEDNYDSYQGAVVFLTSVYQYIVLAVVYSKSHPYRKSLFSNRYLSVSLIACTAISFWFTVYPPHFVAEWLELKMPPFIKYRFLIVFMAALNFLISALAEKLFVDWFLDKIAIKRGWCNRIVPPKYANILEQIGRSPSWLYAAAASELMSTDSVVDKNGDDSKRFKSLKMRLSTCSEGDEELNDLTPMCGDTGETTNV